MTTFLILNSGLGLSLIGSLLLLLGHAVHADRFMHRRHLRVVPEAEADQIAA